jgi:hypothetical protein
MPATKKSYSFAVVAKNNSAVVQLRHSLKAGMICETAEHRAEGMEVNEGGLPKWWRKVGFGRMCSTFETDLIFIRKKAQQSS